MTELAALNVRITGDSGDLKAAVAAANGDLGKLAVSAEAAGLKVSGLNGKFKGTGASGASMAQSLRGVTQQLSQVGQQTMATGNFMQALAIQLPDIGLAFGAVGTAAGLLAGIALPMVVGAFMNGETQAVSLEDALSKLKSATEGLKASQDTLAMSIPELYEKYGTYALQVREAAKALMELQVIEARASLADAANLATEAMMRYVGATELTRTSGAQAAAAVAALRDDLGLTGQTAIQVSESFRAVVNAASFDERVVAVRALRDALSAAGISAEMLPAPIRQMMIETEQATIAMAELSDAANDGREAVTALTAAAPQGGWLAGAIGDASTLASKLWDAAMAAAAAREGQLSDQYAAMGDDERGSQRGIASEVGAMRSKDAVRGRMGGVGGGEGGGSALTESLQAEIQAMQQALMTQEQLQMESFARQQEMLDQALQQRLITQEQYQGLMQQAQATHEFAMQQSVNKGISNTLSALGSLFQGSKKIGAGIALANSWLAFTEVLKDPAYVGRPWARMAAAGQALAAGLNAVKNIKSASPGGAGGSAGGASMGGSAPQQNLQTMNFSIVNDSFGIGENIIRQIVGQINQASRNGSIIRANVLT